MARQITCSAANGMSNPFMRFARRVDASCLVTSWLEQMWNLYSHSGLDYLVIANIFVETMGKVLSEPVRECVY